MVTKARRIVLSVFVVIVAALAIAVLLVLPPAPQQLSRSASLNPLIVKGAVHVHTLRSDGGGTIDDVAAAAAAAGLRFVVITDHGDARRIEPPAYRSGVLCLDGAEVSTDDGHVAAIGLRAAEYPLGGAAHDVIEDVHRLGGIAVAAHPTSVREELAFDAWDTLLDGVEWLNADSEWRDEGTLSLVKTGLGYWLRPAGAIAATFDRPEGALAHADALAADRPLAFLAGHDAHGRVARSGAEGYGRRGLPLPSYAAVFASFSMRVMLDAALSGDAATDAVLVLRALKHGRVFTAIDAMATPARLDFTARSGGASAGIGGRLIPAGRIEFIAETDAPEGTSIALLHNGRERASGPAPRLTYSATAAPGAYRVEVRIPGAPGQPPVPWIVSSPLWIGLPAVPPPPEAFSVTEPLSPTEWSIEHAPQSAAGKSAGEDGAELRYDLGPPGTNPYAALVRPVSVPLDARALSIVARASAPMRVSVQLRSPQGGGDGKRWRRSVYLDATERTIAILLEEFRAVPGTQGDPRSAGVDSLLFVVDTVNTEPGSSGSVSLRNVGWAR